MTAPLRWAVSGVLLLGAVACGRLSGAPERSIPDTARVTCDRHGTRVETPVVRPQRDGVHLLVHNRTREDMAISYQQGRLGAGDNADRGTTEVVFQMAPGDVAVRCSSSVGGDDPPYASFEVVDPKGLYVPAELDCGPLQGISTGHGDYIEGTPGDRRDPLLVATERWSPLEPGEEVQRAGYPRAENRLVLLVRDGRVVEVLEFARDDAGVGWLESSLTTCSERIG